MMNSQYTPDFEAPFEGVVKDEDYLWGGVGDWKGGDDTGGNGGDAGGGDGGGGGETAEKIIKVAEIVQKSLPFLKKLFGGKQISIDELASAYIAIASDIYSERLQPNQIRDAYWDILPFKDASTKDAWFKNFVENRSPEQAVRDVYTQGVTAFNRTGISGLSYNDFIQMLKGSAPTMDKPPVAKNGQIFKGALPKTSNLIMYAGIGIAIIFIVILLFRRRK